MFDHNLATKNQNYFVINEDGEAFVSQPKAAKLLGVSTMTIYNKVLLSAHCSESPMYISSDLLQELAKYYAFDAGHRVTNEAKNLDNMLSEIGAKAFIYSEAGYLEEFISESFSLPLLKPLIDDTSEFIQPVMAEVSAEPKVLSVPEQDRFSTLTLMAKEFDVSGEDKITMFERGLAQFPDLKNAVSTMKDKQA